MTTDIRFQIVLIQTRPTPLPAHLGGALAEAWTA